MRGFVMLVGALSLGCALGGKDDGEDTAPVDADPDPTGWAGACDRWTGIRDGRTWTYAFPMESGVQGGWTSTVTVDGGAVAWHEELEQATSAAGYSSVTDRDYRCDGDGLWFLGYRSDYVSTTESGEVTGWQEVVYTSDRPTQPPDLAVGSGWTWDYTQTFTASYGEGESEGSIAYEVEGREDISVPAGDFSTLQIFQVTNQSASYRSWVADGVGVVASDSVELVEVSP